MKKAEIKVAPSILASDFAHLADEVKRAELAGADAIHIDIMDGHFVPNLSMGPAIVAAVKRSTLLFLDVHLMVYNPYDFVESFVRAGADRLTFHFEATENVEDTLEYIRKCNIQAGLAFRPETSHEFIPRFLDKCDLILLMTVDPGFGGQAFMPEVLEKIRFTRELCDQLGIRDKGVIASPEKTPPFAIQVDGGIDDKTAKAAVEAGANVLVAGTYLFKEVQEMKSRIEKLKAEGK